MFDINLFYWLYLKIDCKNKEHFVECKICKCKIRTSGNTSNMKSHILSNHGGIDEALKILEKKKTERWDSV